MPVPRHAVARFVIRKAETNTVVFIEKPARTHRILLGFDKTVFECAAFGVCLLRIVRDFVRVGITI